jgi:N-hydroxyarylamine O-acetyltransferase
MTQTALDLDAYLARIGYAGPREATLQVLRDLHRLHAAAIAFENLSPLMDEPVSLALADLEAKLVRGGRGGYCYEHNTLLWAALSALGFQVVGLAGRVRWGAPDDAPLRPRSHMALAVRLPEGPFVADVGFGGITMSGPLALVPGDPQQTPHERFRIAEAPAGAFDLQAEVGSDWRTLYRFDLTPHLPVDYEPYNWTSATHPASPFPKSLMAARALPGRRLTLSGARYTVREAGKPAAERTLGSVEELGRVLAEDFGLTLPAGFERVGVKLGLS